MQVRPESRFLARNKAPIGARSARADLVRLGGPASGMKPVLQSAIRLDHIDPSDLASAIDNSGHQDALVQALAAWMEALKPVNWRESGLGAGTWSRPVESSS